MTKEILRTNAGTLTKAAAVQPTKTVGGGVPGSAGKQPLTKDEISKMSDDEVMQAAADGRL